MARRKPLDSNSASPRGLISEHTSDWIRRFLQQLEDHFADAAVGLPWDARARDYQDATIRAVLDTLLDAGMDAESFAEAVGRALVDKRTGPIVWDSRLNQRRFALIDKEIQGTLAPAERMELAGLTRIMRQQLESEANFPMEAARALHRKLLQLADKDKTP